MIFFLSPPPEIVQVVEVQQLQATAVSRGEISFAFDTIECHQSEGKIHVPVVRHVNKNGRVVVPWAVDHPEPDSPYKVRLVFLNFASFSDVYFDVYFNKGNSLNHLFLV